MTDGLASGADVSKVLLTDPADITNKIYKYTGIHFHAFEIGAAEKDGIAICTIAIRASRMPIVFTSIGNYEPIPGKPKTAFAVGTTYFRHGAKSEPGNSDDLRAFLERELDAIKESWLAGIADVAARRFPRGDSPAGGTTRWPFRRITAPAYKRPQSPSVLCNPY